MHRNSQKYYDLLYKAQGKDYQAECTDLAALIKEHHAAATTVLDVGCGTATHARILRDDFNLEVDGSDIDPDMIAIARQKVPEGTFDVADMVTMDIGRQYDAVVSMFSAIGYVKTKERMFDAIKSMAKHVKEDGILIVEPWLKPDVFTHGGLYMDTANEDGIKLCRISRNEVENGISRLNFHWTVGTTVGIETFEEVLELGLFSIEDMLEGFNAANMLAEHFEMENRFSNRGMYIARHKPA